MAVELLLLLLLLVVHLRAAAMNEFHVSTLLAYIGEQQTLPWWLWYSLSE
jgi:hypothetical protein